MGLLALLEVETGTTVLAATFATGFGAGLATGLETVLAAGLAANFGAGFAEVPTAFTTGFALAFAIYPPASRKLEILFRFDTLPHPKKFHMANTALESNTLSR